MPKKKKQKEQFVDVFPVAPALKTIGGKWKGMIVCRLLFKTLRFNELLRSLPGCSQRMLANQLRELQADGIVRRKLFREIPPRVEYSLTDIGRDLLPTIRASCEWSHKHLQGAVADYDCVQCRCLRDLEAVERDSFRTRSENFPPLQSDVGAGA
jgi:DNA-binding HxlR family transcriptional regulator